MYIEKARLQAEAKAAEAARKKAEEEAAAEARRKRELEREAARQALQMVIDKGACKIFYCIKPCMESCHDSVICFW